MAMTYDNPGPGMMEGEDSPPMMGEEDAGQKPHDEKAEEGMGVIHIPQDMLPPGMSEKVKKGDILEFRAIGPADAEGDIPVEYNTGKDEEKGPSWEDSFRKEMSPRSTAGEKGASDGGGAGQGY